MGYMATLSPIKGLEERCARVSAILSSLQAAGFTRPVAFGSGLSKFLNAQDGTKTPIIIECDYPKALERGALSRFFNGAMQRSDYVYKAYPSLTTASQNAPELGGMTFGADYLNNTAADMIPISTRGHQQQRIEIKAYTKAGYRTNGATKPEYLLAGQYGPLNKISMHLDPQIGGAIATHHPLWQADSARGFYRITEDMELNEAHRTLASYFRARAKDEPASLHIDDTSLQKGDVLLQQRARHLHDLHRAASKLHQAEMVHNHHISRDLPDDIVQLDSYYAAARFMEQICEM